MKTRTLLCVMFLLISSSIATAQASKDVAVLTSLLQEFLDGASRNDPAIHDKFWADDLIYTRSAGARTNKAELMKGVRSAPPAKPDDAKTVYSAEDIQIHQYGEAAVIAFRLVANTTKGETKQVAKYLNTGTFIKRDGRWQAVAWQSTKMP